MTENRDAANEVYTPTHKTRVNTAVDTVPSVPSDGTDCSGFNVIAITRSLVTATSVDWTLYYYDNVEWVPVATSAELAAESPPKYTATDAKWFQQFNLTGVFRYKFVLTALVGGTARVTENLSV